MKPVVFARPPSFRWQALLILLPVGLLTVAGFWALRQDRRLVAQDARERAQEALETLGAKVARMLPFALVAPELWDVAGISDAHGEDYLPVVRWDREGRLQYPPDYDHPPLPTRWWSELTPEQRAGWDALARACAEQTESAGLDDALGAWLKTGPPDPAPTAARLVVLQAKARSADAAAHEALWHFVRDHPEAMTPSGLPVMSQAAATFLSHPETDPGRPLLLASLRSCVRDTPSTLTPLLLHRAIASLRSETNVLLGELVALSRLWQSQEHRRQLARELNREWPSVPGPDSRWVRGDDGEYLASFGPDGPAEVPVATDEPGATGTVAWFLPRLIVERALGRALDYRADGGLPYAQLEVSVAGRRLEPAGVPTQDSATTGNAPLLAQVTVPIDRVAAWQEEAAGSGTLRRGPDDFQSLPALLGVRLSMRLVHPDRLYARQRQRAGLLGGLIVAAAGAALLGLAGAHRAFRRQLRLAELKSNFVSSVSHELRAPIASVRLLAESLERGKIVEETRRHEYFGLIGRECRRLSGLIDNVLDFSRIDQGRKRYEFEPTDVRALAGETVRLMEPYAAERRVRLELSAPSTPVELVADGRALQQALVNLLDNAIKHSPEGRPVRIELVATGRTVRLAVTDCGPGIPAADREQIFEPFFRRGSELRRETTGAGIGLSIVRHVAQAHRGDVTVESAPGQGAVLAMEIPLTSADHDH
ncbi:MAG: HAMP domain-containing histidine kinase [Verrucomicrobiales bacterium]|nr:HAMP domain-containing histidine kinase [Verrucomicrobiales bacterium]